MKINITNQNGVILKTAGKLCNEDITVVPDESILGGEPNLQDKTVSPTTSQQTVTADEGYDGLGTVVVSGAELYSREIYPTDEDQEYTPYYGIGFSKVVVKAVTADIDPYIQPYNIKKGITILGVTGTYEGEVAGYKVTIAPAEYCSDTVNIYDGTDNTGPLLASIVHGVQPTTVTCTSGYLYVEPTYESTFEVSELSSNIVIDNADDREISYSPYILKVTGDGSFTVDNHCFIEGTMITLADGSTKACEDITYDDELLVWDFYEGKFASAKPTWIKVKKSVDQYNKVTFDNGAEIGFVGPADLGYHRIFNKEANMFTYTGSPATPNGTTTFTSDGGWTKVVNQEIIKEPVNFYNIITDKHYNLFANGILTSCRLSNKYAIEDMKYVGELLVSAEEEQAYFKRIEPFKVPEVNYEH